MILVCPECDVNYELPVELPEGGCKVRCTSCSHVWHATEADILAPEEAEDGDNVGEGEPQAKESVEALSPLDNELPDELDFLDSELEEDTEEGSDNSQDDIDSLFDEMPDEEGEDNSQDDIDSLFDESEPEEGDDNSQDDIDSMFDEMVPEEGDDNSQDDIDGMFDQMEAEGGDDNSQDDIDGMFDEMEAEGEDDNSQDDIDGMFDMSEITEPDPTPDFKVDEVSLPDDEEEVKEKPAPTPPAFTSLQGFGKSEIIGWAGYSLSLLLIVVVLVFARVSVVKHFPVTASVYEALGFNINVRGLTFTNLQHKWVIDDDVVRLQVEGDVLNLTNKFHKVPKIVIAARSEYDKEIFRWVTSFREKPLLPGEQAPFIAMLPPPPLAAKSILVKFEK